MVLGALGTQLSQSLTQPVYLLPWGGGVGTVSGRAVAGLWERQLRLHWPLHFPFHNFLNPVVSHVIM